MVKIYIKKNIPGCWEYFLIYAVIKLDIQFSFCKASDYNISSKLNKNLALFNDQISGNVCKYCMHI